MDIFPGITSSKGTKEMFDQNSFITNNSSNSRKINNIILLSTLCSMKEVILKHRFIFDSKPLPFYSELYCTSSVQIPQRMSRVLICVEIVSLGLVSIL